MPHGRASRVAAVPAPGRSRTPRAGGGAGTSRAGPQSDATRRAADNPMRSALFQRKDLDAKDAEPLRPLRFPSLRPLR